MWSLNEGSQVMEDVQLCHHRDHSEDRTKTIIFPLESSINHQKCGGGKCYYQNALFSPREKPSQREQKGRFITVQKMENLSDLGSVYAGQWGRELCTIFCLFCRLLLFG